jgi:UDP-N-acetylglucosamine:LPS N-acetylglucosamine transferase
MIRLAIVWWWSGGHVQPLCNLIQRLEYTENNQFYKPIIWFWEKRWLDDLWSKQFDNIYFQYILSWKIRRYISVSSIIHNFIDVTKFIAWCLQSLYYLHVYRIDVLFSKWWYVALPVAFAAKILSIPIITHESDSKIWLANRFISKIANKIFYWLWKTWAVWQLLSIALFKPCDINFADVYSNGLVTNILIMWWSQWSSRIFDALLSFIDNNWHHVNCNFYIIWWIKNQHFRQKFKPYSFCYFFDYLDQSQLSHLYAICDVALCRSGASSVAEMKVFNIVCGYIPLPESGSNHQYYNAISFCNQYPKDTLILEDENLIVGIYQFIKKHVWYKKNHLISHSIIDISKPYTAIVESLIYFWQKKKR